MTDQDRYFYTFDRRSGAPVGVVDAWHSDSSFGATGRAARAGQSMPPELRAGLVLLLFVFAAGMYVSVLLFGDRPDGPRPVIVCPAPGSPPVAALPAECGPPQGVRR
ncbi:hypothetical protein [Nocardia wallacei]|uniref:hypothetical protein n=1 Tax=Nocardia wallacei TaxID=480035 RepID=UPI002454A20F|nr:hypothetical protein [Nocardia wallacei]